MVASYIRHARLLRHRGTQVGVIAHAPAAWSLGGTCPQRQAAPGSAATPGSCAAPGTEPTPGTGPWGFYSWVYFHVFKSDLLVIHTSQETLGRCLCVSLSFLSTSDTVGTQ